MTTERRVTVVNQFAVPQGVVGPTRNADIFSRVAYGARASLLIGLCATGLALVAAAALLGGAGSALEQRGFGAQSHAGGDRLRGVCRPEAATG